MKKIYETPDLELVRFSMQDTILQSELEGGIGENIGGGDGGDGPIDLDGLDDLV